MVDRFADEVWPSGAAVWIDVAHGNRVGDHTGSAHDPALQDGSAAVQR